MPTLHFSKNRSPHISEITVRYKPSNPPVATKESNRNVFPRKHRRLRFPGIFVDSLPPDAAVFLASVEAAFRLSYPLQIRNGLPLFSQAIVSLAMWVTHEHVSRPFTVAHVNPCNARFCFPAITLSSFVFASLPECLASRRARVAAP